LILRQQFALEGFPLGKRKRKKERKKERREIDGERKRRMLKKETQTIDSLFPRK
jgi:hypothetical protein